MPPTRDNHRNAKKAIGGMLADHRASVTATAPVTMTKKDQREDRGRQEILQQWVEQVRESRLRQGGLASERDLQLPVASASMGSTGFEPALS